MLIRTLAVVAFLAVNLVAQNGTYVYFSTRFAETPLSGRGGYVVDGNPTTIPVPVFAAGTVNEAAVMNSNGFGFVRPGVPNKYPISFVPGVVPPPVTDFIEVSNFPQINLLMGDTDSDGQFNEGGSFPNCVTGGNPPCPKPTTSYTNFAGVDALYIPNPPIGRAASIYDCFVSTPTDSGGTGGYRGSAITEADMVMFPKATNPYPAPSAPQSPIFFIRQTHIEMFFGMAAGSGNAIDTDAFAVDATTGDIYISFDSPSSTSPNCFTGTFLSAPGVSTTAIIHAGDIFKIPGFAYTSTGPFNVVSAPISGLVERVFASTDVTTMVTTAGGTILPTALGGVAYTNIYGLDIDYIHAGSIVTPTGFSSLQLFFTVDNRGGPAAGGGNPSSPAIYTSVSGGQFAVLNGVTMSTPAAMGMAPLSFSNGFFAGAIDALDVYELANPLDPFTGNPMHLESFPDNGRGYLSRASMGNPANPANFSNNLICSIAGSPPGSTIAVFARADITTVGGFIDRYDSFASGVPDGCPELYLDVANVYTNSLILAPLGFSVLGQDPFVHSLMNGGPINNPLYSNPIRTAVDINNTDNGDSAFSFDLTVLGPLPTIPGGVNFILTFQAIDLNSLKLSDPMSFEMN